LACCGLATTGFAQNSSLLQAPRMGTVVRSPNGVSFAPASAVGPAPAQLPAPPQGPAIPQGRMGEAIAPWIPAPSPGEAAQTSYDERPPVMLDAASWTYQPAPPLRVFHKNDVVTIRVDEITRVMAEGLTNNRKRTLYEAILTDWIRLTDLRLKPDPQVDGDPAVSAETNSNFRATSSVQSRESLAFNIAATVVDIRPNGLLVLEARKAIRVNDNLWETALSGICRAQDIAPDNVVLSKDLIDLEIRKEDCGHLRDGYKRGWLQRWIDRYGPF
jgi:flagellar L-ring protein precursor FlgH